MGTVAVFVVKLFAYEYLNTSSLLFLLAFLAFGVMQALIALRYNCAGRKLFPSAPTRRGDAETRIWEDGDRGLHKMEGRESSWLLGGFVDGSFSKDLSQCRALPTVSVAPSGAGPAVGQHATRTFDVEGPAPLHAGPRHAAGGARDPGCERKTSVLGVEVCYIEWLPGQPTDAGEQLVDTLVRVRVLTGAEFVVDYLSLRRWVPPPATPGSAGMLRPSRDLPPFRGAPRKEGGLVKRL